MSISSKFVAGVPVPAYDPLVTEALQYSMEGGGKVMRIGIEAPDGRVYRIVETAGMGAFLHAINGMLDLGFKDLLADQMSAVGGFDARMTPGESITTAAKVQAEGPSLIEEDLLAILEGKETERQTLVAARIGQGAFRAGVIRHWGVCAVTEVSCVPLLRASHIRPWRDSNDQERLDPFNGLLLAPNLDAVFDAGYITFTDSGKILISKVASGKTAFDLHINAKMRLNPKLLTDAHRKYLEVHRDTVYRG
jgi:hypothetical protein